METSIISLLDKEWPPEHSFIDGMLSTEVPKSKLFEVLLLVSRGSANSSAPRKYKHSLCIPCLLRRRGVGRFLNIFVVIFYVYLLILRQKRKGSSVILFVRNDPALLLGSSFLRPFVSRLIFQSSFPHEEVSGVFLKRLLARVMYFVSSLSVDVVTGVSPHGVKRAKKLFFGVEEGPFIPLMSDLPNLKKNKSNSIGVIEDRPVRFIYLGTHAQSRNINVILEGVMLALDAGVKAEFRFVGANNDELNKLKLIIGLKKYIELGVISIEGRVSRTKVPEILAWADVGLSLPPLVKSNIEMSPTKLAEYMGAGLAVIASRGVYLQDKFIKESGGGVLINWCCDEISKSIILLCSDRAMLMNLSENSLFFSSKKLQYSFYLDDFTRLVSFDK